MNSNGEILNLEDMFSVIRSENILIDLFKKDCPGFKIGKILPPDIKTRNAIIYKELCEFRKQSPESYSAIYQTMTYISFINANQSANTFISDTLLYKFPEANKIVTEYKYDLLQGVALAAEKAAVIYCNRTSSDECKRAWLVLKDCAASYMNQAFSYNKWFAISPVSRTQEEILVAKEQFEEKYRSYRRVNDPNFDVEVLPVWMDRRIRFIIEMTPPPQPVKTAERDLETNRFKVNNNKNICAVIFEYDTPSCFARMTRSKYGDDKFIIDNLLKLVLGSKVVPTVKRRRNLDQFRTRDYADKVVIPEEKEKRGDKAYVSEIDLSYFEDANNNPNAPITIHSYTGKNIYDQIDRLLPTDKYPVSLRTIHKIVITVWLYHFVDFEGQQMRTGKHETYNITLTPTSCTTSPNIDNPAKVTDRAHAKIIKDYIKSWGLEGTEVCKEK